MTLSAALALHCLQPGWCSGLCLASLVAGRRPEGLEGHLQALQRCPCRDEVLGAQRVTEELCPHPARCSLYCLLLRTGTQAGDEMWATVHQHLGF